MRRVVITGIGIYSCIGTTKEEVISSLREGKCGLIWDDTRIEHGFGSGLTGQITLPLPVNGFMSEEALYSFIAASEALKDSRLDKDFHDFGIIIGNDGSAKAMYDSLEAFQKYKRTFSLGSTHVIKGLNSNPSLCLSKQFKNTGISLTLSGACASGGHSVGIAYELIKSGKEDVILCGGCQEINEDAVFSFDALRSFSQNRNPKEAVRPFDADRDGLAPSGGAACLILEDYDHAVERGAGIYGIIKGYGATSSGDYTINSIESEIECMWRATGMEDPDGLVDVISAHATGTVLGDYNEAMAITSLFKNTPPLVMATKALTGHEMWMSGTSEIIYAILSVTNGFIPSNPNLNKCSYENLNVNRELIEYDKDPTEFDTYILSNSFGLGGTNSSILLKV